MDQVTIGDHLPIDCLRAGEVVHGDARLGVAA